MWQLTSNSTDKRTYTNSTTNSKCEQNMCYVDKEGNQWWEFLSLSSMPFTREFAAVKITSLYALGLTIVDARDFFKKHKETLRAERKDEKYEKAYAEILAFESLVENASDPVKQMSSITCVYFTMNDEPIDSFDGNLQIRKMQLMEFDTEMHTFFLNRQIESIERYRSFSNSLSQIVSVSPTELQALLE